ncbi:MAG: 44, gp44 [Rhodococcus erythropolis]|uniref:recombinase zinc beta ribbon domain-containing protein n=1 Tax=Rhodococcus sp. H-CA8f TaxID=1727214 RepID=UPI001E5BA94B|nr:MULTISPECIES: recombinase zinc beta ribbon domain-containing protein [Rhodococcus]MDF2894687.1 44, gp44 [Rhodococcus erythropolis]
MTRGNGGVVGFLPSASRAAAALFWHRATAPLSQESWLDGGSLRGLVDHLETEGISTVSGKAWKPITIKRALTNPRMIGKKQSGEKLVATTIPPILQPRTYKRLCELLLEPERAKYTGDRTQVALLGGGLARCGGCGRPMYAASTVGRPTVYACSTRSSDCPSIVSVQAELLEADVIERVLARLSSPKYRKALTKSINELGSREEGETRVAELNARFTALGEDFADGLIDRETMRAGTDRVRANIAATELKMAQREVLIDLPEPSAEDIVKWWEEAGAAMSCRSSSTTSPSNPPTGEAATDSTPTASTTSGKHSERRTRVIHCPA